MNEFNKLQNTMGYVTETSDVAVDGKSHILRFVNTEIVDVEVSQNGDKYDVKMLSKKVLGYSQTLQNVEFVPVAKHNNPSSFGVTASGAANYREEGEYAFDNDYGTKWCDNYSPNKWIVADLKSEVFVAQVNIAHAEKGGEASSMNTRKYTIWYAGNDQVFHKWYVETNNRSAYSKHSFAGKKIRYIKMTVEQAEQTGNGASRIYEIELFTKTGLFTATFELNGGTVDGSSDNIVKKIPSGQLLDESIMPNVVKKNYIVEKWMIKSSNEPVVFGTTRINDDETYYPVFEPDPAIKAQLRLNRDKVKDIEFVTKDSEEILTEAEIKAHVEKIVDMDYVTVGLQIESGDTWKLTIKLKEDEEISVSKSVEFIKKKTGETVSVTFDLDGGLYEGSNNNIVYNIEKGTNLTDANIPDRRKITKENNVFVDWYIDTKAVEPNGYLLKDNVVFKAKWSPKPASGSNLHKYIQDVEITQGYQSGWDEAKNPLGYAYDLTNDGKANLKTAATVQFREDKKVELKFKFSQEVEIDKISLSFAGTWIPSYQSDNLKKLDFYGSYDGVNFEKIGEMNNPTKENTVEVNMTKKRAIRYFKLYADMSFTAQEADIWEFYLTNISFFAV